MAFEGYFPFWLVITLITTIPYISMNSVYMSFEMSFPCCLVITLITRVSHISMNRVYMFFEISFPFWLVITLITRVSHFSMNRVYMSFESSFLCCLVITLITTISCIISMKRLNVSSCQSSWCYWSPKLTFHRRQRLEDLDSRDHRTSGWTKLLALFMRVK